MHVLYLKNGANSVPSPLLNLRAYDVTYSDAGGEDRNLKICLENLSAGDCLYVERESMIAKTMQEAVTLLRVLATKGVDVYLGRTKKFIKSAESPYRNITDEIARAFETFKKAYTRFKQYQGYKRMLQERYKNVREHEALPVNFLSAKDRYLKKELTLSAAAQECGVAIRTFWMLCNE